MPITTVRSDPESLTLVLAGDYPVSLERLWQAFSDPRQLERFWGPEQWPAKFSRHDFQVGGWSHYTMTGPDGSEASGWWQFLEIDAPHRIEIIDGFASAPGTPDASMPTMRMSFHFEPTAGGARFTATTRFDSLQSMEQVLKMGMVEGLRSAMGQLDAVLAGP